MKNEIKICKDCKNYSRTFFEVITMSHEFSVCKAAPVRRYVDLVTGKRDNPDFYHCSIDRKEYADSCGPSGRNFEVKK